MKIEKDIFLTALEENASKTKNRLDLLLPTASKSKIADAMRYSVLTGGKRLRAFLALESSKIFNVPETQALQTAAAIECIHSYSLVHDDLPAMDDDDIRRGKPTVHKMWDEATAILVGDGLQSLSFEILSDPLTHPNPKIRLDLVSSLAKASGINGMVGGQALDIEAEKAQYPLMVDDIIELQNLKTGKLIVWAAETGPRLAEQSIKPLTNYARAVGLAFQIRDDILDVIGEKQKAGKRLRKDSKAGKATFVSLFGLEEAKSRSEKLIMEACKFIEPYGEKASMLKELAKFITRRSY